MKQLYTDDEILDGHIAWLRGDHDNCNPRLSGILTSLRAEKARLTARLASSDHALAREYRKLLTASVSLKAERDALTLDRQDLVAENRKLRRIAEDAVRERDEAREALRPFAQPERNPTYSDASHELISVTSGHLRRAHAALAAQAPVTPSDVEGGDAA